MNGRISLFGGSGLNIWTQSATDFTIRAMLQTKRAEGMMAGLRQYSSPRLFVVRNESDLRLGSLGRAQPAYLAHSAQIHRHIDQINACFGLRQRPANIGMNRGLTRSRAALRAALTKGHVVKSMG